MSTSYLDDHSSTEANVTSKAVRNQISESQKIAGGNGSEQEIAEAKIELEVCALARTQTCDFKNVATDYRIGVGEPAGCSQIDVYIDLVHTL